MANKYKITYIDGSTEALDLNPVFDKQIMRIIQDGKPVGFIPLIAIKKAEFA